MTALALESAVGEARREYEAGPPIRDSEWFTGLYQRTSESAYRLAVMLTHDAHTAEDVVSDAFARIWQSRSSFRGGQELPWVLSITRNRALDLFRRRRELVDLEAIGDIEDNCEPLPQQPTPEALDALQECLRRLTSEQQQVVFLRFYEGLPHDVVATRLGKNANAVRAIQFRALARLRSLMEDACVRP